MAKRTEPITIKTTITSTTRTLIFVTRGSEGRVGDHGPTSENGLQRWQAACLGQVMRWSLTIPLACMNA